MFHQLSLLNVSKQASAAASRRRTAAAARGSEAARGDGRFSREEELELELDLLSLPAVGGKQKMDAAGTSKRGRRPPTKPQKLKFKPKVPSRKPKKPPAQKPQLEETKPIDEELMKTLRTGRGDAKTLRVIKDEQSAQNSDSKTLSSAAGVSFQAAQSGKHKQPKNSQKALQIPRAFPANPERFYGDEDDEDEDDDNVVREDDNDVELPESLPSSTECESSIHPAKELNLLEHEDKTRMFLFQLPKSLPLLRTPSTVVHRNGRAIVKEVKEGYNLNDLPGGYMGKMLVYKSGKVKMKLGDAVFDVSPGTECGMQQHAVAVNTRRKHCCQLGEIERQHVVVTPDVNSLLNDNRD
ncbi:nucleolin-like [Triticum urartu]|uniref:DNA-directed RNA polymerase III subunit RPC4 n=1 Tax=Triticum urartu TaxID=4572 RepID=A0A8R7TZ59_TRIUA|nr:nucleolin-like [Triticum urartu]